MKIYLLLLAGAAVCLPLSAADNAPRVQTGTASWYGAESSKKTASGERYDPSAMTAAHRTLPLGTMVQIKNLKTGCCVTVRVNDRGPFCKGRIIDVSKAAAQQLKMIGSGTAKVELAVQK
jgi:rare lipoprotein A